MPRYTAPGYSSCYIDCPAGGYARYITPFGPCRTKCDPAELKDELLADIRSHGWQQRSSATIRGITRREIGELARRLRPTASDDFRVGGILDDLELIGDTRGGDEVDATWNDADAIEALERLRDAASNTPAPR